MEDNDRFADYIDTTDPSGESSTDNDLSLSIYDAEEAAVILEELRRQREEAVRQYRCCICGTQYEQGEGQLLWHINPWFYHALHGHDMHQRVLGEEYLPVMSVSEILRNHGMLVTDGQGRNWMCICEACQRMPNYQQRRPEPVPQATPSRSSNEGHPFEHTDTYPTHLNLWARRLEDHRFGPLEGLPEGHAEDDATGQHSPYSSADIPTPPGNTEGDGSIDYERSVNSYTSSSSTRTQLPRSMARSMSTHRNLPGRD